MTKPDKPEKPEQSDEPDEARPARRVVVSPDLEPGETGWSAGGPVLAADLVGTAAFLLVTVITGLVQDNATELATLVVAGALFVGGIVVFAVGFLSLAGRSRYEVVDLAGTFYLTGSAPKAVKQWFLRLWFAQIAIAVASVAFVRPPFGTLAPVWGISLTPLWASRHGTFPARPGVRRA